MYTEGFADINITISYSDLYLIFDELTVKIFKASHLLKVYVSRIGK